MTSRFEPNPVPPNAQFPQTSSSTPRIGNLPPRTPFTPPPPYEKKPPPSHLTWNPSQLQAELEPTTLPISAINVPQPVPGIASAPKFEFVEDDEEDKRVPLWRRKAVIILLATTGAAIIAAARSTDNTAPQGLAPNPDSTSATAILSSITFPGTVSGPAATQPNSANTGGNSNSDASPGGGGTIQGGSGESGTTDNRT
ncbi:hypothetical protein NP233_g2530 [Leucocoprinus birnbaumii]|uniref:Uncharacterized protein n=1 Tax=Leucocoprinus birnbaumii TaxID=56174 RepID=A0AAD5VYR5_9AGAR|nr:hypothetical protein NP233_g2530 [Leucocoprinus birnbaumii]